MDNGNIKEDIDKALSDYKGAQEKLNSMIDKLKGPMADKLRTDANAMNEIIKGYNLDKDVSSDTTD